MKKKNKDMLDNMSSLGPGLAHPLSKSLRQNFTFKFLNQSPRPSFLSVLFGDHPSKILRAKYFLFLFFYIIIFQVYNFSSHKICITLTSIKTKGKY